MEITLKSITNHPLVKNSFLLTVSEVLVRGVQFMLLVKILDAYSTQIIGEFNFAYATALLLNGVIDFGATPRLLREQKADESGFSILTLAIDSKIFLVTGIYLLLMGGILAGLIPSTPILMTGVFVYAALRQVRTTLMTAYRVRERFEIESFLSMIEFIAVLGLITYIHIYSSTTINQLSSFLGSVGVVLTVVAAIYLKRLGFKYQVPDQTRIRDSIRFMKESFTLALSGFAGQTFYQMNTTILTYLVGAAASTSFSAPFNLMYGFSLIPRIITQSIYPKLARNYRKKILNSGFMLLISALLLIGSLALVTPLVFWSEQILDRIIDNVDKIEGINQSIKILSLFLVVKFQSSLFGTYLDIYRHERFRLNAIGTGIAVNATLVAVLFGSQPVYAGSIAILIAESIIMCLSIYKVIKISSQYNHGS